MDSSLYETIRTENIDRLRQIVSDDDLLLQMTPLRNTTLHVAVQFNKKLCVEEICDRCPSLVMQPNLKGDTPLHIAATLGSSDIVAILIHRAQICHQLDVERGGGSGGGAGGERSSTTTVQQLVRNTNKAKDTALHEAVRYHNRFFSKVVKLLTEADPAFEYSANSNGETPLYLAAKEGLYEFVVQILETCPSSAYGGPGRRTALHAAILSNNSGTRNACARGLVHIKMRP
ncbi:Ankyrin repeat [Macleaya cordata]|uniref:Ankyrin repeat n=1 Tax=Macleaya cordata TaxID=56857 RepID=A0A200QT63_MACCD|nr:Ankyrin repeat [Macleaya cordata]